MRLYLIRHGIAIDRDDPDCPAEAERYLTKDGVQRTRRAMQGLRSLEVKPDAVWSSPFVRAAQTARIAAEELGFDAGRIHTTEALLPGAPPAAVLKELSRLGGEHVACCGHAPNLDEVLAHAVGARSPFTELKKSGVACIDMPKIRAGAGTLLWVSPPSILRRL